MYEVKARVFNYLTKRQKASLCKYLKSFVKINENLGQEGILSEFLEDEIYYNEIGTPHFYFAAENAQNDEFIRDIKDFIEAVFKDIEYKRAQKPFLEAQKAILKEKRREFKQKMQEGFSDEY